MFYIYKIESHINGKVYIGLTNNYKIRKQDHFNKLNKNKHHNSYLQHHFNKYKNTHNSIDDIFYFEIIDSAITEDSIQQKEVWHIERYMSLNREYGFNLIEGGQTNKWSLEIILKRNRTIRNKQNRIYTYDIEGMYIGCLGCISDTAKILNLNRNGVANAFNRGIRYKQYLFYKEKKQFSTYIPNKSGKTVFIDVYNIDNELIDSVKGLLECSKKYNINYNTLNTYCRRGSCVNGYFLFKKRS